LCALNSNSSVTLNYNLALTFQHYFARSGNGICGNRFITSISFDTKVQIELTQLNKSAIVKKLIPKL